MSLWQDSEIKQLKQKYSTELMKHDCQPDDLIDTNLPYDAYLVTYIVEDKVYKDLTRCSKRVHIFDMYYDKFGPGTMQSIDFGPGKVNPKLWNSKDNKK
jgi:hypothetical protein